MKCEDVRLLLAAYRRSEWEPEDQHRVNAHLTGCSACRRWEAEARGVGEQLRQLPTIVPPPSFRESVFAAIRAELPVATQTAAPPLETAAATKTPIYALPIAAGQHSTAIQHTSPIRIGEFGRPRSSRQLFGKTTAIVTVAALLALTFIANLASVLKYAPSVGQPVVCIVCGGPAHYTADTSYPLVTSVIANDKQVFYVGQNTAANGTSQEMLYEIDRTSDLHTPTPLLDKPSDVPMLLEGLTSQQLVWLVGTPQGNWSLMATAFGTDGFISAPIAAMTTVLASQAQSNARALTSCWVSSSGVLLATTLGDGSAQLQQIDFPSAGVAGATTTLVQTAPGHTIVDPYQAVDKMLYWTDSVANATGGYTSTLMSLAPTPGTIAHTIDTNAYRVIANAQQAVWFEQTAQVLVSDSSASLPTMKILGQLMARDAKGNITPLPNAQNIALTSVWRESDTLLWRDASGTAWKFQLGDGSPSSVSALGASATLGLSAADISWAQFPASNDPTAASTIEIIAG